MLRLLRRGCRAVDRLHQRTAKGAVHVGVEPHIDTRITTTILPLSTALVLEASDRDRERVADPPRRSLAWPSMSDSLRRPLISAPSYDDDVVEDEHDSRCRDDNEAVVEHLGVRPC
ncbi:hypothetical protein AAHA92_16124 [Salvia divinorum]|uniref:Uncharacterized protein n=1 Tax=Salvia divinorum TaxID=28513 RepID=A0ABD1GUJ1_SALDI